MNLEYSERQRAFRDEVRAWVASEPYDEPLSGAGEDAEQAAMDAYVKRLREARLMGAHWPTEHGGRAVSPIESFLFFEELGLARLPLPRNILGLLLAGPTIMEWGTPEQQTRWLPGILAGDSWCQGFSEPVAGSDLASLRTRAVRDGDEWVVTGQKIWTSRARHAKWCMLLARTNPDAPKHKGITYFVMDMQQEGVDVRPLRQMTGEAEFSETFLEAVRIPHENVLGGVDNGWNVILSTLAHERAGPIALNGAGVRAWLNDLVARAARDGMLKDSAVADRLADLHIRTELMHQTARRGIAAVEKNGHPGPEGSLSKLAVAELRQEVAQFAADLVPDAVVADTPWSHDLLRARGRTIEGGTHEIQKNIIARRVLGLPRSV